MRSQRRPFTVETKRTRRYWVQLNSTTTASNGSPSDDELTPRFSDRTPAEGLLPEVGRGEALALAAQVFGAPVETQPNLSGVTGLDNSPFTEPVPEFQKPRILPDLLAIAREQSEAEEAAKRQVTRRSRSKSDGQGTLLVRQQIALQLDDPEQSDQSAPEREVKRKVGAGLQTSPDSELLTERQWAEITSSPIHLPSTKGDLQSRSGKAKKWILPRGERWKQRRLPRVCWDKPAR